MRRTTFPLIATSLLFSMPAFADWTQFRGPNALGVSSESAPTSWSSSENLKWTAELTGEGSSSPIISGDAVFLTSFTGEGSNIMRHLMRVDFNTGEILWEKSVAVEFPEDPARWYITENGWASNTPVTDGESVFCYFGKAGVYAFDFDGKELWKASTGSQSSAKRWGSASSPILYGELLIVPSGDETRAVIAFNRLDTS